MNSHQGKYGSTNSHSYRSIVHRKNSEVVRFSRFKLGFKDKVRAITDDIAYDYEDDELIPGLPNQLTVEHVFTKIPAVQLSSVNKGWQAVVKRGEVGRARDRRGLTHHQVAVLYNQSCQNDRDLIYNGSILLYSPSTNVWHQLPPIPDVNSGIPTFCECAYVNGKLYIIGGLDRTPQGKVFPRKEVYSMDLQAGTNRLVWNRCADMLEGRARFSCGIIEGKIYVFEVGRTAYNPPPWHRLPMKLQAEVYNPLNNTWRALDPKLPSASTFDNPDFDRLCDMLLSSEDGDRPIFEEGFIINGHLVIHASSTSMSTGLVYVPEEDKWWMVGRLARLGPNLWNIVFRTTINGDLYIFQTYQDEVECVVHHKCSDGGELELDCRNLWRLCDYRANSFFNMKLVDARALGLGQNQHPIKKIFCTASTGDGEMLIMHERETEGVGGQLKTILSRSKGFGEPKSKIEWKTIECPLDLGQIEFPSSTRMCLVETTFTGFS